MPALSHITRNLLLELYQFFTYFVMQILHSSISGNFLIFLQSHKYFLIVAPKMFKQLVLFAFSPSKPPK